MPGLPVKMTQHYNRHWSRPPTRTYGYNHSYMSNYYRPMTHYLSKVEVSKKSMGTPRAHSFAERIHKFPMYGGMYKYHETAGYIHLASPRSSSLPPPAARRSRGASPARGFSAVRGASPTSNRLEPSSVLAEVSSARGSAARGSSVQGETQRWGSLAGGSSVQRETQRDSRYELMQRRMDLLSSASRSSFKSLSEARVTESQEMSRAEKAVAEMRQYLKHQTAEPEITLEITVEEPLVQVSSVQRETQSSRRLESLYESSQRALNMARSSSESMSEKMSREKALAEKSRTEMAVEEMRQYLENQTAEPMLTETKVEPPVRRPSVQRETRSRRLESLYESSQRALNMARSSSESRSRKMSREPEKSRTEMAVEEMRQYLENQTAEPVFTMETKVEPPVRRPSVQRETQSSRRLESRYESSQRALRMARSSSESRLQKMSREKAVEEKSRTEKAVEEMRQYLKNQTAVPEITMEIKVEPQVRRLESSQRESRYESCRRARMARSSSESRASVKSLVEAKRIESQEMSREKAVAEKSRTEKAVEEMRQYLKNQMAEPVITMETMVEPPVRSSSVQPETQRRASLARDSSIHRETQVRGSSVQLETRSSRGLESSQRASRMARSSSASRPSLKSLVEARGTQSQETSRAEMAVDQMRQYLKNQTAGSEGKHVPLWKKHPYYLPVERIVVPPHEGSIWPEGRRHFDLVSSYDCMVDYLGIKKPE